MKKLLSMAAIAALITTGTYAAVPTATDGQAIVKCFIPFVAIVRIGSEVDQSLAISSHLQASDLDMGTLNLGKTTSKSFNVYVRTNTYGKVTMKFTDVQPLIHEDDKNRESPTHKLTTTYSFSADDSYNADSAKNIATNDVVTVSQNASRNNNVVGTFDVKVTTASAQRAGEYYAVLPITVTASL